MVHSDGSGGVDTFGVCVVFVTEFQGPARLVKVAMKVANAHDAFGSLMMRGFKLFFRVTTWPDVAPIADGHIHKCVKKLREISLEKRP